MDRLTDMAKRLAELRWEEWIEDVSAMARGADWQLLSSYGGLLGLAVGSIYVGAHGSVPRAKGAKQEKKTDSDAEEDEDEEDLDRVSADEAWLFPIIGSAALLGLYVVVQYFGTVWVNWLMGWYFALAGVGSVWNSSKSLVRWAAGEARWKNFDKIEMSVKKGVHGMHISLRTPSAVLLPLALVPSGLYAFWGGAAKSVLLTDVLALSFAHNAVSLLRLDSFPTGCILLGGLFVYDVWWVFGTDVMVKVATSLDAPIKLLWPRGDGYTMLGLGDVVIPGTFVALALRYDRARGLGRCYFWAALAGYVLGLGATMAVMHIWGHAQPALLYLSPACMGAVGAVAAVRGEVVSSWTWVDK